MGMRESVGSCEGEGVGVEKRGEVDGDSLPPLPGVGEEESDLGEKVVRRESEGGAEGVEEEEAPPPITPPSPPPLGEGNMEVEVEGDDVPPPPIPPPPKDREVGVPGGPELLLGVGGEDIVLLSIGEEVGGVREGVGGSVGIGDLVG